MEPQLAPRPAVVAVVVQLGKALARVHEHAAELPEGERPAVAADAHLPEERGPGESSRIAIAIASSTGLTSSSPTRREQAVRERPSRARRPRSSARRAAAGGLVVGAGGVERPGADVVSVRRSSRNSPRARRAPRRRRGGAGRVAGGFMRPPAVRPRPPADADARRDRAKRRTILRTAATTSCASARVIAGESGSETRRVPDGLGRGEVAAARAQLSAVPAMQVHRHEVDAGADVLRGQRRAEAARGHVAARRVEPQRVQVPRVPGAVAVAAGPACARPRGPRTRRRTPPRSPGGCAGSPRARQLVQTERGLQVGHVVLEAGVDDLVAPGAVGRCSASRRPGHAVQAQRRGCARAPASSSRGQHAALAGGDVLGRVEAERRERARASRSCGRGSTPRQRMGGVLDHRQAVRARRARGSRPCRRDGRAKCTGTIALRARRDRALDHAGVDVQRVAARTSRTRAGRRRAR